MTDAHEETYYEIANQKIFPHEQPLRYFEKRRKESFMTNPKDSLDSSFLRLP